MIEPFRTAALRAPEPPRREDAADSMVETTGQVARQMGGAFAGVALSILTVALMLSAVFARRFVLFAVPWVVLGVGAATVWAFGLRARARARTVVRDGAEAHGEVTAVKPIRSVRMNGRSPYRVDFVFDAAGSAVRGRFTVWNKPSLQPGQSIVVLYDRHDPRRAVLWSSTALAPQPPLSIS